MKIAIAGSSGLIGSALSDNLQSDGHDVLRLVRRTATGPNEHEWDPATGDLDMAALAGVEAVVNLAGAGVGDHRWTDSYKREIRSSRINTTETLSRACAELSDQVKVFVAGSAVGFYGDRGTEELTEESPKGTGFLTDVVADWEAASDAARQADVRVANIRTGLVVSEHGGAWARMLKIFKVGLGGKLGSGDQYWSFISLRDEVRAIRHVIDTAALSGPVNLTSPNPTTNRAATKALGSALSRPTFASVPGLALKAALGEFSTEVLSSSRVLPIRLEDTGFTWLDPDINAATKQLLAN